MAHVTIELTPDLYERLRTEAQRQGKAEQTLAQELLVGQLLSGASVEVPLYVQLLPQIRALAAAMNPEDFMVPGEATPDAAIALLRSWTEEASDDEDAESWADVLRSIDANRPSYRKLFPHLEKPA